MKLKKPFLPVIFLVVLTAIFPFLQKNMSDKRKNILEISDIGYIIPSTFTGPAALEFKGILSDFLYLKISTFLGEKIIKKEKFDPAYADHFYNAAQIITDIDPWFWDVYLMNSMILAWDFRRIDLANKLLQKAVEYRSWDFGPAYYLGFNYYFFLKNNELASKYLLEAARRGGGPSFLLPLATRLSVYQDKFTPAILLLKEELKNTQDPIMLSHLQTRLKVLIILDSLENKVTEYKSIYGELPTDLKALVDKKLIKKIPDDPYGGNFYIMKNGRVYTTSEMRFAKSGRKKSN